MIQRAEVLKMGVELKITYHYHSGFSVACGKTLLVFDYWLGQHQELPMEQRITAEDLAQYEEIDVFVSHAHRDHLDPIIFEWEQVAPVRYVIAYDIPQGVRGLRMAPGSEQKLSEQVSVRAFDSTDTGVSFLVDLNGAKIFHAGDLNFWHWREISTMQEIAEEESDFQAAVKPIIGEQVDVAFFPVDPRQGLLFDAGANYFMMSVKPKLMIPMHFWGRTDVIGEYARRNRCRQTEILPLTKCGAGLRARLEKDKPMEIAVLPPRTKGTGKAKENQVSLDGYEGKDPFHDSDLPVDLT